MSKCTQNFFTKQNEVAIKNECLRCSGCPKDTFTYDKYPLGLLSDSPDTSDGKAYCGKYKNKIEILFYIWFNY